MSRNQTNNKQTPEDTLYGSGNFEPTIVLVEGGATIQLEDAVKRAFTESKLSVKDWNELEAAPRDAFIQAAIDAYKVEAVNIEAERLAAAAEAQRLQDLEDVSRDVVTVNDAPGAGKEVVVAGVAYKGNKNGEFTVPLSAALLLEETFGFKRKL